MDDDTFLTRLLWRFRDISNLGKIVDRENRRKAVTTLCTLTNIPYHRMQYLFNFLVEYSNLPWHILYTQMKRDLSEGMPFDLIFENIIKEEYHINSTT